MRFSRLSQSPGVQEETDADSKLDADSSFVAETIDSHTDAITRWDLVPGVKYDWYRNRPIPINLAETPGPIRRELQQTCYSQDKEKIAYKLDYWNTHINRPWPVKRLGLLPEVEDDLFSEGGRTQSSEAQMPILKAIWKDVGTQTNLAGIHGQESQVNDEPDGANKGHTLALFLERIQDVVTNVDSILEPGHPRNRTQVEQGRKNLCVSAKLMKSILDSDSEEIKANATEAMRHLRGLLHGRSLAAGASASTETEGWSSCTEGSTI